jgi:hypothetical protein
MVAPNTTQVARVLERPPSGWVRDGGERGGLGRRAQEVEMPVGSFVMGAEGWTPLGLKGNRGDTRMLPVGPIHAAEPQGGTSVCGGLPVELDREGRTFTPWGAGTCDRCSEALHPRG